MWRRIDPVAGACLIIGVIIVGGVLCEAAHAGEKEPIRFGQLEPAYVATDYSTSPKWNKAETPYLKAQASMFMTMLRQPVVMKGHSFNPELAFTWRAVTWPVGAESSPISENNYLPEAYLRVDEDEAGWWRGARIGWLHCSTGTGGGSEQDSISGSIDRVLLESKFAYSVPFNATVLNLTGYVRGWYVTGTGSQTNGIEDFINFKLWKDAGGELRVIGEVPDVMRGVVTLGLSYQHYEIYIPLAKAYDVDLFGQLHHGNANGILDYADRATSGGVGLALVR